jgi:hypothetical protein
LGNFYNITGQPEPISPLGKGLVTYDEFRDLWLSATIPFVIVVKEKNFGGMEKVVGESPRKVAAYDEYWLVTRPSQ